MYYLPGIATSVLIALLDSCNRGPDCIKSSHLSYGIHSAQSDNPERNAIELT